MTDREKLIDLVRNSLKRHIGKSCNLAENIVDDIIQDGVTVQKESVWIINWGDGYYPYCKNCRYEPEWSRNDNRTKYCPNCGAKMRKEVEDG